VSHLTGACPAIVFDLDDDSIHTSLVTTFAGGSCSKIKKNSTVTVRGVRQPGGWILASRVDLNTKNGDDDDDR
jgi:hypothetical protein